MTTNCLKIQFQSSLATVMTQFIQEKKACGYQYDEEIRQLKHFDLYLSGEKLSRPELPRPITRKWLAKHPHESTRTHQHRISVVRQLAKFMIRLGYFAYVPEEGLEVREETSFMPRILTYAEIQKLFQAVDQLVPTARAPLRHIIMPEIFRLLYGCGFRLGEVLKLRIQDVDLNQGVLTVRQGKLGKDRLVPPALSLVHRLHKYAAYLGNRPANTFFFPSPNGGAWSLQATYHIFRKLLLECGIAHAGRGRGPRVHDLRHTFAVHTLVRWYREGADIDAKLPLLAAYMGHQNIRGTQQYLHLTAELFPEINKRVNAEFSDVIPRRVK